MTGDAARLRRVAVRRGGRSPDDATCTRTIDLRPTGSVDLSGVRDGDDFRWLAYVATDRELGQVRRGADRTDWPGTGRRAAAGARRPPTDVADETVDLQASETALTAGYRATARIAAIEVIEGAPRPALPDRGRRDTFADAFPQVRWLVGDADLDRWRGQLDYWVFLDGQLGQVAGSANGEAVGIEPDALQAHDRRAADRDGARTTTWSSILPSP